jgi:hypothetical protein
MAIIQRFAACSFMGMFAVALCAGGAAAGPADARPDLSKPLRTRVGAPICVSREELQVLIGGGESDSCLQAAKEVTVTVSERPAVFSDIMRIRFRSYDGKLLDVWTLHNALQN